VETSARANLSHVGIKKAEMVLCKKKNYARTRSQEDGSKRRRTPCRPKTTRARTYKYQTCEALTQFCNHRRKKFGKWVEKAKLSRKKVDSLFLREGGRNTMNRKHRLRKKIKLRSKGKDGGRTIQKGQIKSLGEKGTQDHWREVGNAITRRGIRGRFGRKKQGQDNPKLPGSQRDQNSCSLSPREKGGEKEKQETMNGYMSSRE